MERQVTYLLLARPTEPVHVHSMVHDWSVKRWTTLLSSTHKRNNTLTDVIDIPAHRAQEGGGASKGHFTVGWGFHVNIAALCVLTSQPWWVSNGGVWIITIQGAGAVTAHRALDIICRNPNQRHIQYRQRWSDCHRLILVVQIQIPK